MDHTQWWVAFVETQVVRLKEELRVAKAKAESNAKRADELELR